MLTTPASFLRLTAVASLALAAAACGDDPEPAPEIDECIPDVSAGDHKFSCNGVTFLTMVDPQCEGGGCGLIFDIHGATMTGAQMRDNTKLHELATAEGYVVVHPSVSAENVGGIGTLWTSDHYPHVADFMQRAIRAYKIDPDRVHVTGFSQGGAMTIWFMCNHNDLLASVAPVAGALNTTPCFDARWSPRLPTLIMNGITDTASTIDSSRTLVSNIVDVLGLSGGEEIDGDGHYTRTEWQGADGMLLDVIEHDYGGQAVLAGHCIPGGTDLEGAPNNFGLNATTCSTGEINLNWGPTVLQWFIDHPRAH